MIGRKVSHYRVERRLGAGGMGEVYLARDLALGREAALKLLPEGFAPELRARLLHEARASARLQHPGIATFYESGEAEGAAFIAMEYVPGLTLREHLQSGALPPEKALAMGVCVLEALAHAHAAGLLHRDIKPENVMITAAGSAKLLDFGLAKEALQADARTDAPTATALTGAGNIVGTVGYMSPEQLRGDPVDARTDVFAAAAVLYEAISGRPAFPGATPTERLAAILSKDPAPLTGAGLPRELWAVLARALARENSRRYPSAAAFLSDLHRVQEGGVVTALPESVAVLDLQNLSGDAADNWLGSGIAETLATDLARVPGLRVIPREKVLQVRGALGERATDPIEIGLAIGCGRVLSGSFQKLGAALRVTLRVLDVSTGETIASEKIDGRLEDLFQMQDRLAAAVAASLNVHAPTPAPARPSLGAYECYARGRRLWVRMEKGSFEQARELYEQAIAQDPAYAPALAGLAAMHAMRFTFTTDPGALDLATSYARRAIAADPRLGEPYVWLGYALTRQERFDEAFAAEKQALALDPGSFFAAYMAAAALVGANRAEEALPFAQKAVELEPTGAFNFLELGWIHFELGNLAEARWSLGKAVEVEGKGPNTTAGVAGYLGECLRRQGQLEEARRHCLAGLDVADASDHMYRDIFRGFSLCTLGRVALEQGDQDAARAAFGQAASHIRGRPRAVGSGHILVQALAGLARAGAGEGPLAEALDLFETRKGPCNFLFFYGCVEHFTLLQLARAARALGRADQARRLYGRAREAGSLEAAGEENNVMKLPASDGS
jgi:serine/threonine-protein kinase